jgi:hypothetical protein
MGARINFVFDDGTEALVVLYSHSGEYTWQDDLAGALDHAQQRQGDYSYFTRMVISHLIKDSILQPTGFGLYAIKRTEISDLFDKIVILDLVYNLITDLDDSNNSIPFYGEMRALNV